MKLNHMEAFFVYIRYNRRNGEQNWLVFAVHIYAQAIKFGNTNIFGSLIFVLIIDPQIQHKQILALSCRAKKQMITVLIYFLL